jgi:nicotinate-nucleotide pyrophosphorylase (carboxylating)
VSTIEKAAADIIRRALEEDVRTGDVTTESTVPEGQLAVARIVAKQEGVLAGVTIAEAVFRQLEASLVMRAHLIDGELLEPGTVIATIKGRSRAILTGERTALNFLQRLSGIATLTARYTTALRGTGVRLLDTRKTTPGLRILEKYAVAVGGGVNHRMGLWDMALIKENHIAASAGIGPAVAGVRARHPGIRIEVEVTTLSELDRALDARVDRVMLDNMEPEVMERAIARARAHAHQAEIEVSGNVTLEHIGEIAALRPDFISVGAITHSAPALDMSLLFRKGPGD